jgi:AraC-like DNA-binding protein
MVEELFEAHPVARTVDRDEACAAVTEIFLPHRLELIDPCRPLDLRLNAVRLGRVTAGYMYYGTDVHIYSEKVSEYHVNLPLRGVAESRTGLKEPVHAAPGRAAVFLPDLPADVRWRADCAQLCVMINRRALDLELETLLGESLGRALDFAPGMNLTTPAGRSWVDVLLVLNRESGRPGGLLAHPLAAQNLEELVIDGLLLAQPHNYTDALAAHRRSVHPRAVQEVIDLIQAHPERPWTPASLARNAAVSVRSLQEGFHRSMGTSPMAYVRDVRLTRAHQELLAETPQTTTVTRVASRWGFLQLGRFAASYRAKFGELPSRTLRK